MSHRGLDLLKMGTAPLELVYDPDVVIDLSDMPIRDLDQEYRGLDGARRFWTQALEAWSGLDWEAEFYERDDVVVAVMDQHNRAPSPENDIHRHYAQLLRFRDSKIIFWKPYADPDDALRAAGIEPEASE